MKFFTNALAVIALSGLSLVAAQQDAPDEPLNKAQPGKIIQITSSTDFCLMLPAEKGQTVGLSEGSAVSYCMGTTTDGARTLPAGTITGAHVVETDDYIQVTGTFDYTKVGMVPGDDGGQYDNAPKGSEPFSGCSNYNNSGVWLSLVSSGMFCSRCCKSAKYNSGPCSVHQDLQGCYANIPGDYTEGTFTNNGNAVTNPNPVSNSTTPTTGAHDATGTHGVHGTHTAVATGGADARSAATGISAMDNILKAGFAAAAAGAIAAFAA